MSAHAQIPSQRAALLCGVAALVLCGACEGSSDSTAFSGTPFTVVDGGGTPRASDGGPAWTKPADQGADEAAKGDDPGGPPPVMVTDIGLATDEGSPEVPGEFGAPCRDGEDCASGFCVPSSQGFVCTVACTDDCPDGWECRLVNLPGADATFLCLEALDFMCRPCAGEADCGPVEAADGAKRCLQFTAEEGSFCSELCAVHSDCPFGFECTELTLSGRQVSRCLPEGGRCECSQAAVDAEAWTECSRENEAGSCTGTRSCTDDGLGPCTAPKPGIETCDGVDEDCDGEIDEGLVLGTCEKEGLEGRCAGKQRCVEGEIVCDAPEPVEEICNGIDDDCDGYLDEGFEDIDGDGVASCVDHDDDGDGVPDDMDRCPDVSDPQQPDLDGDGYGDACDEDDDGDGVVDGTDVCPTDRDPGQADTDGDGFGDACDEDDDGDGVRDGADVCPKVADPGQEDRDGDGLGNACDDDRDGDGIPDERDLCPDMPTLDQRDTDHDGRADPCDDDDDDDGVPDTGDVCPKVADPGQEDNDEDRLGDACDADDDADGVTDTADMCPMIFDPAQVDTDGDGRGDACDEDDDGDGVRDGEDGCPLVRDAGQRDTDGDGRGDACDEDDDGDGVVDGEDLCPLAHNPGQEDTDGDGVGDACEADDDGDGIIDEADVCPAIHDPGQEDADGDGVGDACDEDDDNDDVRDEDDLCPKIPDAAQLDTDGDGQGDACDDDDDGDGTPDGADCAPKDAAVAPDVVEACNGVDDNCDGGVDVEDSEGCTDYFKDVDSDGYGGEDRPQRCLCVPDPVSDYTALQGGDCDDFVLDVRPGAPERCNDRDDNCDGDTDETFPSLGGSCDGPDSDLCANGVVVCAEDGLTTTCSREEPRDIVEVCNGADEDCDGLTDEGFEDTDDDQLADCVDGDDDNDGAPDGDDCAPLDSRVRPGAEEKCDDGLDNDCDATTLCRVVRWGNGSGSAEVVPLETATTPQAWYSYHDPVGSSVNVPGLARADSVQMGLISSAEGELFFVFVLDAAGDPDGGTLNMTLGGSGLAGVGARVVVQDDPQTSKERYDWSTSSGTGTFKWRWAPCCTDGMVLGPLPAAGPFCIRPTFSNVTGIRTYQVFGPPSGSFARTTIPANRLAGLEICVQL